MDDKERIEQLKAEIQRVSGGQTLMGGIERLPPDVAVKFLEHVLGVEKDDAILRKREAN